MGRSAAGVLIWALMALILLAPVWMAAGSPLLAWRQPAYVVAGFAGIAAMALLFIQPLLAARVLPGLSPQRARRLHRACGIALVTAVGVHVAGLWITSPPDMIDALTFSAPTLFSPLGVVAMWALIMTALLAGFRRRLRWRRFRALHLALGVAVVGGSVAHALLITGTMETVSKWMLCFAVLVALGVAIRRNGKR